MELGGRTFTVLEILTDYLRTLRTAVEASLGVGIDRARVVVAVPAHAYGAQRDHAHGGLGPHSLRGHRLHASWGHSLVGEHGALGDDRGFGRDGRDGEHRVHGGHRAVRRVGQLAPAQPRGVPGPIGAHRGPSPSSESASRRAGADRLRSFQAQQEPFAFDPSRVARQGARGADEPVAGDDDAYRVASGGGSDGAGRPMADASSP